MLQQAFKLWPMFTGHSALFYLLTTHLIKYQFVMCNAKTSFFLLLKLNICTKRERFSCRTFEEKSHQL